jgi:hypothetical protein
MLLNAVTDARTSCDTGKNGRKKIAAYRGGHRSDCDVQQPCDSPFKGIALREGSERNSRQTPDSGRKPHTLLFESTLF